MRPQTRPMHDHWLPRAQTQSRRVHELQGHREQGGLEHLRVGLQDLRVVQHTTESKLLIFLVAGTVRPHPPNSHYNLFLSSAPPLLPSSKPPNLYFKPLLIGSCVFRGDPSVHFL